MIIKLASNEGYQELLNRNADSSQLSVSLSDLTTHTQEIGINENVVLDGELIRSYAVS